MSEIKARVPSNGTLLIQPNGAVQLSGRIGGDPNQVVTFNPVTKALESTDSSRLGGGGGKSGDECIVTISDTPPQPAENGQLWWNSRDGRLFVYYDDGNTAQWVDASPAGGGGSGGATISPTPPADPNQGDLWWNSDDGRLYIYYIDPESAQWVDTNPNGGGGGNTRVTISDTPPTGAAVGDLWWNDQDGRLYIYYDDGNTQQWVDTNPNGGGPGGGSFLVSISPTPPSTPSQGQLWWNSDDGRLYVYYDDGNTAQWVDTNPNGGGPGGVPVIISDIAPGNATPGQLWWNTVDGRLFVYYDDGNTAQWVDASPAGGVGPNVTKTTISPTPPQNPNEGDLWWNDQDGRFYIYYDDGSTAQWVDTSPAGGTDLTALQQTIIDLEARVAALENP